MDSERFLEVVNNINEQRSELLKIRGIEYAKPQDQLASFKEVATIWNTLHPNKSLQPSNIAELLVILKQIRLANLSRQGSSFEKYRDTHLDYHNYIDLQVACQIEEEENALRES